MLTNSVNRLHYGFKDCPEGWPGAVGLRFKVGDNDLFRVGFAQERQFRELIWRIVEGRLVKGEVEMTEIEHQNWEAQGLRLAPGKKEDHYYSIEPVSFESAYRTELGYHGVK